MRLVYFSLLMLYSGLALAQLRIQLSPPQVVVDSVFFAETATVRLELDYPGVELRYTLDGGAVDSQSPVYHEPLRLSQSATVTAQAFHPGFEDSPEAGVSVRSLKYNQPLSVTNAIPIPAPQYTGAGLPALADRQKGALNFSATPRAWLGWETDTLRLQLEAPEAGKANTLVLSLLDNAGAWIMPPATVQVYDAGEEIGRFETAQPEPGAPTRFHFLEVPLSPWSSKGLEVVVLARQLPDWHNGAGRPAWIFLDELFLTQKP
jgi:hypothetical protein